MIKKLQLHNFQAHKNTTIDFTEGLNCIVGSTHTGKSSIVRALRWVLFNDQLKNFITWGETDCQVILYLSNGFIIKRIRSKTLNRVVVVNAMGIENIFDNFGDDYPKEVFDACNIKYLTLDDDQIYNVNIYSQHDNLFMLSESGAIRAKALNSLIDLTAIDNVLRDLASDIKSVGNTLPNLLDEKFQLEEYIKNNNTDLEESKLNNIKIQLDIIKKNVIILQQQERIVKNLDNYNQKINNYNQKLLKFKQIDFVALNNLIKSIEIFLSKYRPIYDKIQNFNNKFEIYSIKIKKFFKVDINILNKLITDIDAFIKRFFYLKQRVDSNDYAISLFFKKFDAKYKEVSCKRDTLYNILLSFKKCPICYSNISEQAASNILERL